MTFISVLPGRLRARLPVSSLFTTAAAACGLSLLIAAPAAWAQDKVPFTAEQVAEGEALYVEHCQMCHGTNLDNGQFAPPIKGFFFDNNWSGRTLGELITYLYQEMPPGNSGVLSNEEHRAAAAFILFENGHEPGSERLSGDLDKLNQVTLP